MEKVDVTEQSDIDPETGKQESACVYVRGLTGDELNELFYPVENFQAMVAVYVCCDENGLPFFKPGDED